MLIGGVIGLLIGCILKLLSYLYALGVIKRLNDIPINRYFRRTYEYKSNTTITIICILIPTLTGIVIGYFI